MFPLFASPASPDAARRSPPGWPLRYPPSSSPHPKSALLLLSLAPWTAAAQPPAQNPAQNPAADIRARYTKYDYRIPMRDGVKLFTSVYLPKDSAQPYPIMMERTPYSVAPYGIDRYPARLGPSELFSKEGFIFVYQDVRGRYLSEGAFVDVAVHKTSLGPK